MEYTELADYPVPAGRITEWIPTVEPDRWQSDDRPLSPNHTAHLYNSESAPDSGDLGLGSWIGTAFRLPGDFDHSVFAAVLREEGIAPYPGSLALIERLRAAGTPIGVVSSSKNAEEVLAAAGIRDYFRIVMDGVVAAREGLRSKPEPDMFAEGARMLGVDPARSAAVEDAHSGVQSAAAAGFALVVGVDRGAGAQALLDLGADLVVDDLAAFVA